jgi:ribosome-binding factor A
MATMRTKRVGEEIQKVISEKLIRGLRDPLPGFVTVREVEVNRDFTRAKVYYSVIGSDEDKVGAAKVLEAERGHLRREVGKKVRLRNTPELFFIQDDSGERAARIHQLLDEVNASGARSDDGGADAEEDEDG